MAEENKNNQTEIEIGEPTRLLTRIAETDSVDYKAKFSKDKEDLYNTVKVFAAMANFGGGLVIYGVHKQQLVGIDDSQAELLDPARLKGMLGGYLSQVPPLSTEIISHESRKFGFVTVDGITSAPVLVSKTFTDGSRVTLRAGSMFIRENTESVEITSEVQARHILDRVINFQVRKRLSEIVPIFLDQKPKLIEEVPRIEILGRKQAKQFSEIDSSTPIREAIYYSDSENPIDPAKIREAFKYGYKLHGLSWPHYAPNSKNAKVGASEEGYISSFKGEDEERRYFSRIDPNGSMYACSTLLEDDYFSQGRNDERFKDRIVVGLTLNLIVLAVRFGHAVLQKLETVGSLDLVYSIKNIKDRKLVVEDFNRGEFYSERITFDENISARATINKDMTADNLMKVSQDLAKKIYLGFNWNDPGAEQLDKDVRAAFSSSQLVQQIYNL